MTGLPGLRVEFRDRGDQTEVVLVHRDFPEGSPEDPYRLGWESGLEKLAAVLDHGDAPTGEGGDGA